MSDTTPSRIGIIAGQGDFPVLIARAARGNGVEVVGFPIRGFAGSEFADACDQVVPVELGQVGKTLELLHQHGIRSLAIAGRVPHVNILQYRHFDMRAMKLVASLVNKKADSILGAITRELETEGIHVMDSSLFLKKLMPAAGLLTPARPPDEQEQADIRFGYPIAKAVAGQDIGQTIVVKEQVVVAVEGIEGTDECIRRAAALAGPGCVVIKVSKPHQDMRFDIPVIGKDTVRVMQEAGCTALALSAGECLIFDRELVLEQAARAGIAVVAE